jgi:hypothetical protein
MKKEPEVNSSGKKEYQKPTWQKEQMFERFTLACSGATAKRAGTCSKPGS